MAKVAIGSILILLFLLPFVGGLRELLATGVKTDVVLGMTVGTILLLVPGTFLVWAGLRFRGTSLFLLPGAVLALDHGLAVRAVLTGAETWSTPHLVLMNLLLDPLSIAFLAAGLHPLAMRLGVGGERYSKAAVLVTLGVMAAATTIEVRLNDRTRSSLLRDLQSSDPAVRIAAAEGLAETGYASAVPALAAALSDPELRVRMAAARALGLSEERSAAAPLATALRDPNPRVQLAAIEGLAALWDKRREASFVPALAEALDVASASQRSAAGRRDALKATLDMDAAPGDAARVRESAARLLEAMDDERGVAVLVRGLENRDLALVAGAHGFFIRRGIPGSEAVLAEALEARGSKEMAEHLLNCGNATLADAALRWARARGYDVKTRAAGAQLSWGSRP